MVKIVGLIPCRFGSKRIPNKNIKLLNGHPLVAYTICAAKQSGVFDAIIVSSNSRQYLDICQEYGATPFFCPSEHAHQDMDRDFKWVSYTLQPFPVSDPLNYDHQWVYHAMDYKPKFDYFSILRPTNPFRKPETIARAVNDFLNEPGSPDSMRAVELCKQHPEKMWELCTCYPDNSARQRIHPIGTGYNLPYQALETRYIQNAALEVAKTENIVKYQNVSGFDVMPFFMSEYEGFDLNVPLDWLVAEMLIEKGLATLPEVK